jgi:arginase
MMPVVDRKATMAQSFSTHSGDIDIIGFPMDLGADRRGVDMGPSALRIAGLEEKLTDLGYAVHDEGNIAIGIKECQTIANHRLKYMQEIVRTAEILSKQVELSLERYHLPLCIGGDHSLALGSIAGVSAYCRRHDRKLGVIWLDAHADANTDKTTPSGNIHGMVVSAALGLGHPELTGIGGFSPKLDAQHFAIVGVRSIDPAEKENIQRLDLPVYTMTDVDRRGMDAVMADVLQRLKAVDHVHVSFDLDCVDPAVAAGVGTPVTGGLTYREAHLCMETIAEQGGMHSMDVVEVNPILDIRNQSARLASDLVASGLGQKIL